MSITLSRFYIVFAMTMAEDSVNNLTQFLGGIKRAV